MVPGKSTKYLVILILFLCVLGVLAEPLTIIDLFEHVVLGFVLFYADVISDYISLVRFWERGQKFFFGLNASGIGLNCLASGILCGLMGLDKSRLLGVGFALMGFFQLHTAFITASMLIEWKKPEDSSASIVAPVFMAIFRSFELIEASLSTAVQGYAMTWDTKLSSGDEEQLRVSVCLSMVSLANGLVLLDKSRASKSPVVDSISSLNFIIICVFRLSEVVLSFGSLFLFQVATRPYGGFVVVGLWVLFNSLYAVYSCTMGQYKGPPGNDVVTKIIDVGSFILMIIPLTLFHAAPVGSAANEYSPMTLASPRLVYFAMRMFSTLGMFGYLVWQAGGVANVWEFWTSYTDSALLLAHAVLVAAIAYPCCFAMTRIRFPQQPYEMLK